MYIKKIVLSALLSAQILVGQSEMDVQGAFGAVTIDGELWNHISLRPVLTF